MNAVRQAPLRLAIAGANAARGWANDAHIPALAALPGFSLYAVSGRGLDMAETARAAWGAERAFGDSLAMVRGPAVDVVAVTCKVPEHRAIVLAALAAGKHVYCEWPLGRDVAEAEEMAAAARRAGTHVAIGLQGAHSPAVQQAAALVAEGRIGRPASLNVVSPTAGWGRVAPPFYAYLQDRRNGATLATIAGGHTLAMVEAVVGPYVEVAARNSILTPEVEIAGTGERIARTCADHMVVTGLHTSGCVSVVEIVSGQPQMALRFELRGSTGRLGIAGHHPGGYQCAALSLAGDSAPSPGLPTPDEAMPPQAVNVAQVYAALERDIRSGSRTAPDFDRAVSLARLLEAVDLASDESRTIRISA